MRLVAALLFVVWFGCLPPPRSVVDASPSGPPAPSGDDSADTWDLDDPNPDDTGIEDTAIPTTPLKCHALAFENNGHVQISAEEVAAESLFTEQSLTIELWAWFSDETRDGSWLLVGMDGNQAWRLGIELGELVLRAGVYSLSIPMPENGWNHIAGVIDGEGSELSLYINGAFSGRKDWNPPMVSTSDNPFIHLGAWHTEGGSWPSAIDEVRLAHAVVHQGVTIETSPERPTEPWLGVWRFDKDLKNAVSGVESLGTEIRFTDSCP